MVTPMVTTLPDGTAVRLRFIRPDDKPLLEVGLTRLSADSVHQRFLAPKARFSTSELRYLTELDGRDHVAIVAVLPHDPDTLVGVARFVRDPRHPVEAEAAIVIADHLQGMGLGRTLGRLLADEARARGVRRFTATLLGTNVAAHRLFAAISRRLTAHYGGGLEELVAELVTEEHRIAPRAAAA
jgi:RimJ/RimL family protein N-acetyltransferase